MLVRSFGGIVILSSGQPLALHRRDEANPKRGPGEARHDEYAVGVSCRQTCDLG